MSFLRYNPNAINEVAAEDARIAREAGAPQAVVDAIAKQPVAAVRANLMRSVALASGPSGIGGGSQANLIPTRSASGSQCRTNDAGARDNLPGITWTDIAALEAYDGPWEFYESRMSFYATCLSEAPGRQAFQGRTRVQGTASPLDIAAAQTVATRSFPVGFRIEITVPGDSAPSVGTFALAYVDGAGVGRTLNFSAVAIAGRMGVIRILPGLAAVYGRPTRHTPQVNNALVVTSGGLLAPVTPTGLTFSGLPANSPVAVELIQPGSPTYLEDLRSIVTAA